VRSATGFAAVFAWCLAVAIGVTAVILLLQGLYTHWAVFAAAAIALAVVGGFLFRRR